MRRRLNIFESLLDGLRRNIKHESHANSGGKILKITSTKEGGEEGVVFVFVFECKVDAFGSELIFSDVEIGLRIDKRVGFDRGVLFELEVFLNMGII